MVVDCPGGNLFLVPRGLSLQARFISISTTFYAGLHVQAVFLDLASGLRVRRRMTSSGTVVASALQLKGEGVDALQLWPSYNPYAPYNPYLR
jgi:hypothetical protein